MNRLSSALMVIAVSMLCNSISAQSCAAKESQGSIQTLRPAQTFTLNRLRKCDSLSTVLADEEVQSIIKSTMGSDTSKYFNYTKQSELPDVQDNELYSLGFTQTSGSESFLVLNLLSRKACIALRNNDKLTIYGADSLNELPRPMILYIDDLKLDKNSESEIQLSFHTHSSPQIAGAF